MKQVGFFLLIIASCMGCTHQRKLPDVSKIPIHLPLIRFEASIFNIDTLHVNEAVQSLYEQEPSFTQDFLYNILGSTPSKVNKDLPAFLSSYQPLYKDASQLFKKDPPFYGEVKEGLQYLHHYFPSYPLPKKLICFVGPINSFGNILTQEGVAIGLQLYMGNQYPLYLSAEGQQLYPSFISRKFTPDYIAVNCMKNILDDLYPNASLGKPLIEQMIASGKRLFLLQQILPNTADTITTGYSAKDLRYCLETEKALWSFFIQNNLLFSIDPSIIRDYTSEGPYTQAFGEGSPANIGLFLGWQIVKKYMAKFPETKLDELMRMQESELFAKAKYKP